MFSRPLVDVLAMEGEGAVWECEVYGRPEPDLCWYREGRILPLSEDFKQSYDGEQINKFENGRFLRIF